MFYKKYIVVNLDIGHYINIILIVGIRIKIGVGGTDHVISVLLFVKLQRSQKQP